MSKKKQRKLAKNGGNKTAAAAATAATTSSTPDASTPARKVKISFGPPRPPPPSSSNGNSNNNSTKSASVSFNFGTMDLSALKEAAAATSTSSSGAKTSTKSNQQSSSSGPTASCATASIPCTEADLNALMGMFSGMLGMNGGSGTSNSKDGGGSSNSSSSSTNNNNSNNAFFNQESCATMSAILGGIATSTTTNSNGTTSSEYHTSADGETISFMDGATTTSATMIPPDMLPSAAAWDDLRRITNGGTFVPLRDPSTPIPDMDELRQCFFAGYSDATATSNQQQRGKSNAKGKKQQGKQQQNGNDSKPPAVNEDQEKEDAERLLHQQQELEEEEERVRKKAAKKREKKQRKKQKLKEEADVRAQEALQKKKEKAILSWRSRIVSACQTGELSKLEALLQESPFGSTPTNPSASAGNNNRNQKENKDDSDDDDDDEDTPSFLDMIRPHLEFLLPNCIAKHRSQVEQGEDTRHRMATYVLSYDLPLALKPLRNGRSALHVAAFHGDFALLELLIDRLSSGCDKSVEYNDTKHNKGSTSAVDIGGVVPRDFLSIPCKHDGWTPLHYAAVSGSLDVLELLLRKGASLATLTNSSRTHRQKDGLGVTPKDLVHYVQNGSYDKVLETKGGALQEVHHAFLANHQDRRVFVRTLNRVMGRLGDIEKNGYTAPRKEGKQTQAEAVEAEVVEVTTESAAARKRRKKKLKKQAKKEETEAATEDATQESNPSTSAGRLDDGSKASIPTHEEEQDPLVVALLGMGFSHDQIVAAVAECGGADRATADDVVMKILSQTGGAGEEPETHRVDSTPTARPSATQEKKPIAVTTLPTSAAINAANNRQVTEVQKREESARLLADKREQQRRRNREWNNRELARQQHEAKAKAVRVLGVQPAPSSFVPATQSFPLPTATVPTLQTAATPVPISEAIRRAPTKSMSQNTLPLGTAAKATSELKLVDLASSNNARMQHVPQPFVPNEFPSLARPPAMAPAGPPTTKDVSWSSAGPTTKTVPASVVIDDDRTVSSLGSSRGPPTAAAAQFPLSTGPPLSLPPGFAQPPPLSAHERLNTPGDSYDATADIRASAKSFVPNSYPIQHSMHPTMAGKYASAAPSLQLPNVLPTPPLDETTTLPPGMLHPSLLGSMFRNPSDRVPSVTLTEESSSPLGIPSLGLVPESSATPFAATSLLSSTFTNGNTNPMGNAGLWGETTNPIESNLGVDLSFVNDNKNRAPASSSMAGWNAKGPSDSIW